MLFTRIPQQYAPLGGELRYAVSQETAGNIDIRIVDAAAGSAAGIGAAVSPGGADRAGTRGPVGDGSALLGAKRFAAVAEAAFDAAPYLRRRLHFTPATGRTGFYPAEGRTVTAVVEAAGTCGTVVYSVTPAVQGQVRLAWRSSAGSVEHYTFPIVRTTTVRTERREAEGPQGRVVAAAETDREIVLVSAYETRSMLEPLAELTATAAAWIVTEKRYIPVDIATEEAVVQRRGTLSCLEIAIRPKRKKHAAWN